MTIEELEQDRHAQESRKRVHWRRPPMPSDTPLVDVNWRLVGACAFGFFVWYIGYAVLDFLVSTATQH